jgi:hypothetical protein
MASRGADIFDQSLEQVHLSRVRCSQATSARPIRGASEDFEERIVALVRARFPEGYCCRCIAAHLEVPELPVRNAAQVVIGQHPGIRVARGQCGSCRRSDEVLMLTPPPAP